MLKLEIQKIINLFDQKWSSRPYHYVDRVDNTLCEQVTDIAYLDFVEILEEIRDEIGEEI